MKIRARRVMALVMFGVTGFTLGAVPTGAQEVTGGSFLSASELRRELFGVELSGLVRGTELRWRECVDPRGTTRYSFEGDIRNGRLEIRGTDQACFAYEDTGFRNWACWRARRDGENIEFQTSDHQPGGILFLATRIRRNVKTCAPEDAPIG
jgi:hypothetical protein